MNPINFNKESNGTTRACCWSNLGPTLIGMTRILSLTKPVPSPDRVTVQYSQAVVVTGFFSKIFVGVVPVRGSPEGGACAEKGQGMSRAGCEGWVGPTSRQLTFISIRH